MDWKTDGSAVYVCSLHMHMHMLLQKGISRSCLSKSARLLSRQFSRIQSAPIDKRCVETNPSSFSFLAASASVDCLIVQVVDWSRPIRSIVAPQWLAAPSLNLL